MNIDKSATVTMGEDQLREAIIAAIADLPGLEDFDVENGTISFKSGDEAYHIDGVTVELSS